MLKTILHRPKLFLKTNKIRCTAYRHHEQSFTSKRSRSFSIFFLLKRTQNIYYRLTWVKIQLWTKYQHTRCLLQRHRWHPCMPQQCAYCACMEKCKRKWAKTRCVRPVICQKSINMLPCTDELITRRKSSPTMDGLERAKIKCQIFHTVRTTMVEIYTRGHFGWFAGHCCFVIRSIHNSGPLVYWNIHSWGHRFCGPFGFTSLTLFLPALRTDAVMGVADSSDAKETSCYAKQLALQVGM